MRATTLALTGVLVALGGCKALPDVPAFVCGNGVIEPGEDCDSFVRDRTTCRSANLAGACHFTCATDAGGNESACPVGFGCDATNVCRRTTGRYDESEVTVPGVAFSLLSGDFDGDGRDDILSLEAPSASGLARPSITFFDRGGAAEDSWAMTKLIATPVVAAVSDDPRADLVSSTFFALSVLLGQPDRQLITDITPSFFLNETRVRLITVSQEPVEGATPILILAELDGNASLNVTSSNDPSLTPIAELPAGIDALSGPPATADIDEDDDEAPCFDVVLGFRGATELTQYQPCQLRDGIARWRATPVVAHLPFEPASTVAGAPLIADLDGDGHLDLFVLATAGPYAAFGDGRSLGRLVPFELGYVSDPQRHGPADPAPIAAGDITGDGIADFVDPRALLLSVRAADGSIAYEGSQGPSLGSWTEARIADFTGDGLPDAVAVAAGVPNLDFVLATGTNRLNPFSIRTPGSVRELCVADFDGDTLPDLAYVEGTGDELEPEAMAVSFGARQGPLSEPVLVAHLDGIEQLVGNSEHSQNAVADVLVTHQLTGSAGPATGVSLVAGSGDRRLFSPVLFNNYSADGLLDSANSVALTVGAFSDETTLQVAALAVPDSFGPEDLRFSAWLLPDLRHGGAGPQMLDWGFDERFVPVRLTDQMELTARLLPADLDGDRIEELVVASPVDDDEHCLIQIAHLDHAQASLTLLSSVELDDQCQREPTLAAEDVDGDGTKELAILAGTGSSQRLLVLWNDGSGHFSQDQATSLLSDAASPRAFALFRSTKGAALRAAVVTERELFVLEALAKSRTFRDLGWGRPLDDGTGVVAADVDGDGVNDLVVADAGNLRVIHAALGGL